MPIFEPALWHQEFLCGATNCYAYAANDPYGHLNDGDQRPGLAGGYVMKAVTPGECVRGAEADGMIFIGKEPVAREGHYLVALRIHRGVDFHFMRQDDDGRWSCKYANGGISREDERGVPITDPRTACFERYDEFVGFFLVPGGGVRTAERLQEKPVPKPGWGEWLRSLLPGWSA